MMYLESVKINKFKDTYIHGLTLSFHENLSYYIYSNNKAKLDTLYFLIKIKKNYLNGNILINNTNITKLDKNNLDNFYYKNVAFCDKNLLFNNRYLVKEYVNVVEKLSHSKSSIKLDQLLSILCLRKNFLDLKITKLNEYQKSKLILIAGILKNTNYILLKLDDFNLNQSNVNEIMSSIEIISKIYKKTIIVFNAKIKYINNLINLENLNYYKFNNRLTINEEQPNFEGYKLIKHKFNIFTVAIKQSYKIYFIYFFISLLLMILNIFILTILNQNQIHNENNFINYINSNKILFYVLGYGIFAINILFQCIIAYRWYKNNKKYLIFLSTFNIHNLWVSLLIPIILIINTFLIVMLGYMINIIILNSISIKYNIDIWNTSLYTNLVYILETFLICYILILRINNISNFYKVFMNL